MSGLEERNLEIIKSIMLEVGVKDIEELPNEIRKLKAMYSTVASQLNSANHTLYSIEKLVVRVSPKNLESMCHYYKEEFNSWKGMCGFFINFDDDDENPIDNGIIFCPGCGRRLTTASTGQGGDSALEDGSDPDVSTTPE